MIHLAGTRAKRLPWALALIAFVIGIPLFFEVGVVILLPVIMLAARRANLPVILLGIPALAGLSALHGRVPPHPGTLIAIDALNANLGMTLGLGLLVALPTVAIAQPLLAKPMAKRVPIPPRDVHGREGARGGSAASALQRGSADCAGDRCRIGGSSAMSTTPAPGRSRSTFG